MASVILNGDTSGTVTLSAPAVAGSTTQTLVAATGTLAPLVSGTAVASTSGTAIDFTGIPSWVKRITVMFNGVSVNSTSNLNVQLGSGTFTTTGYLGSADNGAAAYNISVGFSSQTGAAAWASYGHMIITNISGNQWVASHVLGSSGNALVARGGGGISLGGVLDRIRITSVNGTDTFDAGTINIMYE